jgi:hypothetical protein
MVGARAPLHNHLQRSQPRGNGTPGSSGDYMMDWTGVEVFFATSCALTFVGTAAIVLALNTPLMTQRLARRDASLRSQVWGDEAAAAATEAVRVGPTQSLNSDDSGEGRPLLVQSGGANLLTDVSAPDSYEAKMGAWTVAVRVLPEALSQFLVIGASQMVVSQYANITAQYYTNQTTLLLHVTNWFAFCLEECAFCMC